MSWVFATATAWTAAVLLFSTAANAQSVCLPAPRLLTTTPMGGQAGTTVEVTIAGDHIEDAEELRFSHPGITAAYKLDDKGLPVPNTYVVTIAADCPVGVHEARVMTRLGVSSSRAFNVGALPEVTRTTSNTSLETAMPLQVDSICNASVTRQAIDYFTFEAAQGQRIIVDCAAKGIDSKLKPVVVIADAEGGDLLVERRGGLLDFTVPISGTYVVKVHDLTFNGGNEYFYRLAVRQAAADELVERQPSVRMVSAFSWPPTGLTDDNLIAELEPNNEHSEAQQITLPCDISGSFYPAADVDTFEFTARKGEVWWVEVASERFGLPTDPSIIVQHVSGEGENETLTDVVELSDIPSPVKVSSNGYSYDGPPYNAGSSDILGKVEIQADGVHRLQLRDLFGGTRSDPNNIYRMVIRKAEPDFALVGWALHMNLRNGDRNALSKPMALRGGNTMAFEVVVVRRDGFDGEIELVMENLPEGVTAAGLKIPAGKSDGKMLVTAAPDAPRGLTSANFYGRATINGEVVTRPCRLASMQWPVPNAWSEIPSPRLLADVPVSVCGSEQAPITIAAANGNVIEATAGETVKIPLVHTRRSEFSGPSINLNTWATPGLGNVPAFDASLKADNSEAVLDLAALKTPPGEYTVAFYGSAVAKYQENLAAVAIAETALKQAQEEAAAAAAEAQRLTEAAQAAAEEEKANAEAAAQAAAEKQKAADAAVAAAEKRLQAATNRAKPKDIVDIVVSTPITLRVKPAEEATQP
ncbi:MAG: serine protease [Planctomycetota bacterium]|nr:MAG: serine protease [Planctomycetota bacterium]REK38306.1 MAG: serine protease [Planctomycetota bacterium]